MDRMLTRAALGAIVASVGAGLCMYMWSCMRLHMDMHIGRQGGAVVGPLPPLGPVTPSVEL